MINFNYYPNIFTANAKNTQAISDMNNSTDTHTTCNTVNCNYIYMTLFIHNVVEFCDIMCDSDIDS